MRICLVVFLMLIGLLRVDIYAENSVVYDNLRIKSKILKSTRSFAVYLPPGYESSKRSYPVLYLLHGYTGFQYDWIQFGDLQRIADEVILTGQASPMIIIMPDATTGYPGYSNRGSEWRYEDYFFKELLPHVESKFRIRAEKQFRAIAGLSMGGGGTMIYALRHLDLFAAAVPLSAYVGPDTFESYQKKARRHIWNTQEAYNANHPLKLIETLDKKELESVKWYVDCGDDDVLLEDSLALNKAFRQKGIKHEFRIREGAHNWTYWRKVLPDTLTFVSQSFRRL